MRRVYSDSCPPHFITVDITINENFGDGETSKKILDWIFVNLQDRFYYKFNLAGFQTRMARVGFENPQEATIFSLQINHLLSKSKLQKI